jgi:hypothetical protein
VDPRFLGVSRVSSFSPYSWGRWVSRVVIGCGERIPTDHLNAGIGDSELGASMCHCWTPVINI